MATGDKKYFLPLTGGTMTGSIICNTGTQIAQSSNTSAVAIYGGDGNDNGARLVLRGKSNTKVGAGTFDVDSYDGTTRKILRGTPAGELTWDGKNIISEENGDLRYLKLTGGTMTGPIVLANGNNNGLNGKSDASMISLNGGTQSNTGGCIDLYGKSYDGALASGFDIMAADADYNSNHLRGFSDGKLLLSGRPVLSIWYEGSNGEYLQSTGSSVAEWGSWNMTTDTLWSGYTNTTGNYSLAHPYTDYAFLAVECLDQYSQYYQRTVSKPENHSDINNLFVVSTNTNWLHFYFPDVNTINLQARSANGIFIAVYGVK